MFILQTLLSDVNRNICILSSGSLKIHVRHALSSDTRCHRENQAGGRAGPQNPACSETLSPSPVKSTGSAAVFVSGTCRCPDAGRTTTVPRGLGWKSAGGRVGTPTRGAHYLTSEAAEGVCLKIQVLPWSRITGHT